MYIEMATKESQTNCNETKRRRGISYTVHT